MRRRLVLAVLLLPLLAACGGGPAPSEGAATAPPVTTAPAATTSGGGGGGGGGGKPGTNLTACQLVTPGDIEAALSLGAGTLDAGTLKQSGTTLDPAANECRYAGDWGGLIVNVTPTDGVNTFDAVESAFGDDAEKVQLADGALWFPDNKRGYFLKGSVMVLLQFSFIKDPPEGGFRDATIAIGTAAVGRV